MKKKTDRVLHSLRNQQTHHENSKLYPKQKKPNRKKNTLYGREYEMGMQEVKWISYHVEEEIERTLADVFVKEGRELSGA